MAHRSERGYLVRPGGGPLVAFVPHPEIASWWFRTHPCTMIVVCPFCKSPAGEPCRGRDGFTADTHTDRRSAARDKLGNVEASVGIVLDLQLRLARRGVLKAGEAPAAASIEDES